MIDMDKLKQDYNSFIKYRTNYKSIKLQVHDFYMSHIIDIENHLDEYYENVNDRKKCEELFCRCPNVKIYLSLEAIKKHYKEEKDKYMISSELSKLGKCVICNNENNITIYDIDKNKVYNYEIDNVNLITYIEMGLKKINKFISYVNQNEINVVKVIISDIKDTDSNVSLSEKEISNKINNELMRARMFDASYIFYTNDNEIFNLTDEFKKILDDYSQDKISKKEYFIRYYYYLILCDQKIDELYLNADNEHKEYIVDAYLKLSEYSKSNKVRIRTTSSLINEAVLKRKKKTDAK